MELQTLAGYVTRGLLLSVLYIARVGLELECLDWRRILPIYDTFSPLHSEGGIGTDLYALFSTSNSESLLR